MTTDRAEPKEVLTAKELAARWSITIRTLSKWRRATLAGEVKGPPFFYTGTNRIRYRMEDVRAYEEAGLIKPRAAPADPEGDGDG